VDPLGQIIPSVCVRDSGRLQISAIVWEIARNLDRAISLSKKIFILICVDVNPGADRRKNSNDVPPGRGGGDYFTAGGRTPDGCRTVALRPVAEPPTPINPTPSPRQPCPPRDREQPTTPRQTVRLPHVCPRHVRRSRGGWGWWRGEERSGDDARDGGGEGGGGRRGAVAGAAAAAWARQTSLPGIPPTFTPSHF